MNRYHVNMLKGTIGLAGLIVAITAFSFMIGNGIGSLPTV